MLACVCLCVYVYLSVVYVTFSFVLPLRRKRREGEVIETKPALSVWGSIFLGGGAESFG